jgi:hypothetical protein
MAVTGDRWIGASGRPTRHILGSTSTVCRTRPCADLAQAILTTSNPDFFPSRNALLSTHCARPPPGASTAAAA